MKHLWLFTVSILIWPAACSPQNTDGSRQNPPREEQTFVPAVVGEIPLPPGYERRTAAGNSMAQYLRNLKLRTDDNTVYLYNGQAKNIQTSQYAVLSIDAGKRDLQQCADAAMRLRAEYLFRQKQYRAIHFNFLSDGKPRYYTDYAKGDYSYKKFRKYMNYIFAYANTASLKNEMLPVDNPADIKAGDVFIQTGNPYGHAVTVMDAAENKKSNELLILLSQSYMPAQDIHILINPENKNISPWYKVKTQGELQTPEWTFYWHELMRFPE